MPARPGFATSKDKSSMPTACAHAVECEFNDGDTIEP